MKDYAVIGGGMDTEKNGGTEDIYNSRLWSPLAASLVTLAKQQMLQYMAENGKYRNGGVGNG